MSVYNPDDPLYENPAFDDVLLISCFRCKNEFLVPYTEEIGIEMNFPDYCAFCGHRFDYIDDEVA